MRVLSLTLIPAASGAQECSVRSHFRRVGVSSLSRLTLPVALLSLCLSPGLSSRAQAQMSAPRVQSLLAAHAHKLSPALRVNLTDSAAHPIAPKRLFPVIIQTDGIPPASARPLLGQTSFKAFSRALTPGLNRAGTRALVAITRGGMLAARLTRQDLAQLAADPHTLHISPDLPVQACSSGYLDYAREATGLDFLQVNNHLAGQGVTVAVVDTGIYPHDDLATPTSRIVGWTDLVNSKPDPYDDNGHGTHVAGLVAGDGTQASQNGYSALLTRAAPSAQLVGVKALDKNGSGNVSSIIAGVDWCVTHKADYNIRVLNLSIGHPVGESYKTDPLCQACERALAAGIVVVVAAGNAGRSVPSDPNSPTQYGSIDSPGNDPYVITVGAMNTLGTLTRADDKICTFSSRGPTAVDLILKPDLVAPGNGIISLASPGSALFTSATGNLLDPITYGGTGSKGYLILSGTSMAAPIVSGAAALLLQNDSTLTPDTIKARLMLSATKTANMDYLSYGAGYLNVVGALALTQVAATASISPALTHSADGTVTIINFGWGGDILDKEGKGSVGVSNFGWGDDLPPDKASVSDYLTAQNFGWGDNFFGGSDIFGQATLPANVAPGNDTLWSGDVAPLSTPDQADSMSLLFNGD